MKYLLGKMKHLSWSAISSFEWDPEQWYDQYYLGIKTDSKEMAFGRKVDEELEKDPKFIPHVPRYEHMQYKMKATFHGIPIVGVADTVRLPTNTAGKRDLLRPAIRDYKTGKKEWDQKRADETGQLTMYALLLHLNHGIHPEDVELFIDWLPTVETNDFQITFRDKPVEPVSLETKRTMRQMLEFGQRILDRYEDMHRYVKQRT